MVRSLIAVRIPTAIIDISQWGGAGHQSHSNEGLNKYNLSTYQSNYRIHIFVVNAANTPALSFENGSNRIPLDGYKIGLWHWETSYIPTKHCAYLHFFHEIWVPAAYIAAVIKDSPCTRNDMKFSIMPYSYDESVKYNGNGCLSSCCCL